MNKITKVFWMAVDFAEELAARAKEKGFSASSFLEAELRRAWGMDVKGPEIPKGES